MHFIYIHITKYPWGAPKGGPKTGAGNSRGVGPGIKKTLEFVTPERKNDGVPGTTFGPFFGIPFRARFGSILEASREPFGVLLGSPLASFGLPWGLFLEGFVAFRECPRSLNAQSQNGAQGSGPKWHYKPKSDPLGLDAKL